ncbi:hypothetical protein BC835DRAFT_1303670 [Cytidiella melzeri]|nr:hypothetical protein BC835DRAFT_1303670 [Cytidiella melzeri]
MHRSIADRSSGSRLPSLAVANSPVPFHAQPPPLPSSHTSHTSIKQQSYPFRGPLFSLFLLGADSILWLAFFPKSILLGPTVHFVFDDTLDTQGQHRLGLLKNAENTTSGLQTLLWLSGDGFLRCLVTFPLNTLPVHGTVLFLLVNGQRSGPGWQVRYIELKGFNNVQQKEFTRQHRPEYDIFGASAFALSFIPIVGVVLAFTSTVGAAQWAADMEARSAIVKGPSAIKETDKSKWQS